MGREPTERVWSRIFLKEWRLHRRLSVERLAEKADVSPALISLIENGKSGGSPESLEKLAAALGIEVGELLDIKPSKGGSVLRVWVRDEDRERVRRIIQALSGE
jgi:transcriptional regulator with XRE-family HTH domain